VTSQHRRQRGPPGERVIDDGATSSDACHDLSITRGAGAAYP
jgi:hypothetical protein